MRERYFRLAYLGSEQLKASLTKREALDLINGNQECFSDDTEINSWRELVDESETLQGIEKLIRDVCEEIQKGSQRLAEKEMADNPDFVFDYEDEAGALRLNLL